MFAFSVILRITSSVLPTLRLLSAYFFCLWYFSENSRKEITTF
jgi:hypothetical protein